MSNTQWKRLPRRVTEEQRTVWLGGGRAWLTRASAYRAVARSLITSKYPCECEPFNRYDCGRHTADAAEHYAQTRNRLASYLRWLDKRDAA